MVVKLIMSRCLRAVASVCMLLALGSLALTSAQGVTSARAADLTADQIVATRAAVDTALANIDPALTGVARQNAVRLALATTTVTMVKTYGAGAVCYVAARAVTDRIPAAQVVAAVLPAATSKAAGVPVRDAVRQVTVCTVRAGASATQVAEAVISTALLVGLPQGDVGSGLGDAAAELSGTNQPAAFEIARVVSNEGTSAMQGAFHDAVINGGGSQELADAGSQNPEVTGETAGGNGLNGNGNNGQFGTGGSTLPTCTNPSCT